MVSLPKSSDTRWLQGTLSTAVSGVLSQPNPGDPMRARSKTRTVRIVGLCFLLSVAACGGQRSSNEVSTSPPSDGDVSTTAQTIPPTTTSTSTTLATTTTLSQEQLEALQLEADIPAIKTLWRRFSDSWSGGVEAGYNLLTEHNHPLEECSGEDWKEWRGITDEELSMEVVVDEATIERDDTWPLPSGPNAGTVVEGRIYIHQATITEYLEGYDPNTATLEIHTVVDDQGDAFFFFSCS